MSAKSLLFKLREPSGQSLVELALVLPVLVVIFLGIIDLCRAINAYNGIANISREGASLASRSGLGPQKIMNVLADTAKPLAMQTNGMIYITEAQVDGTGWTFTQEAWQGKSIPPSTITSASVTQLLDPLKGTGRNVYICEVFYKYDSLFLPGSFAAASPLLHSTAIF